MSNSRIGDVRAEMRSGGAWDASEASSLSPGLGSSGDHQARSPRATPKLASVGGTSCLPEKLAHPCPIPLSQYGPSMIRGADSPHQPHAKGLVLLRCRG